jgi:hypothetical protein
MSTTDFTVTVHQAWEIALGMPVSQDTDFFDAGGHSFVAIQIATRLQESLGRQVPARLVFDHPILSDYIAALTTSSY